jgi:hypothetical protein
MVNNTWTRILSILKVNVYVLQLRRIWLLRKFAMLLLETWRRNWFIFKFVSLCWIKTSLWLMINYENMNKLLHFLDVKNFWKITHWSNEICWEMASCMNDVVVKQTKYLLEGVNVHFFFMWWSHNYWYIKSPRFPYVLMWLKIFSRHLCYYPCNELLMGPLLII